MFYIPTKTFVIIAVVYYLRSSDLTTKYYIIVFLIVGQWDGKRKNKSFWPNFRKSQKGGMRQMSKGTYTHIKYMSFM